MAGQLAGKVALITGSDSGIGQGTAAARSTSTISPPVWS